MTIANFCLEVTGDFGGGSEKGKGLEKGGTLVSYNATEFFFQNCSFPQRN